MLLVIGSLIGPMLDPSHQAICQILILVSPGINAEVKKRVYVFQINFNFCPHWPQYVW